MTRPKILKSEIEFVVYQGPGADGTIPSATTASGSRIFARGEGSLRLKSLLIPARTDKELASISILIKGHNQTKDIIDGRS